MSTLAPVSMLTGKGSGPALLVLGLLVAVWMATKSTQTTTTGNK